MSLRFRDSFQVFPGVRLNLSGSGVSVSFGVPGATVNFGPKGARSTVGIPGSGLSSTHKHQHHSSPRNQPPAQSDYGGGAPIYQPAPSPSYAQSQAYQMREINSASVEELTSHSLVELRDMISQARSQQNEITSDLNAAKAVVGSECQELDRRRRSWFRVLYKKRIAALEESIPQAEAEVARLESWLETTHIDIKFDTSDDAKRAFGFLARAFDKLAGCGKSWDVTSDRQANRVIERTAASRTIMRHPVVLDYATTDLVRFDGRAIRFGNVNGEPIMIYPGVAIMPRADGAFALIDLRDIQLESSALQFVEEEAVPPDSQVVGHTWAKVNKDGSPDRRFNGNYQIPVCLYGVLVFTSPGGVQEEYQFSNAQATAEFARAFEAFRSALAV